MASAFTLEDSPLKGPAIVVDIVATVWAIGRTNEARDRGEISTVTQYALNGTGLFGLIPGEWGFGFSVMNTIVTVFGFPYP